MIAVLNLQMLSTDEDTTGGDLAMLDSTTSKCCFGSTNSNSNCCNT